MVKGLQLQNGYGGCYTKKTNEENQEKYVPYHEKVGIPLDDELLSDNDDENDDLQCFPSKAPKMTCAELALQCQQVDESGVSNQI
nr:hypothetical protein CFP56_63604 [Quercus suber]